MTGPSGAGGWAARWLVPAGIVALSVAAILISTTFDRMPPILKRGIQPADFPQLVAGLIIALVALMAWRDPPVAVGNPGRTTWLSLLLMALFAALTPVDFFIALGVFAVLLAALWGERRPAALAAVGALVPLAVFLLFDLAFEVRFPRGVLTSLWYG